MAKKNFADEAVEIIIDSDFNPDIVLTGVKETFEVGLREGFFKGFTVGFGLWFVGLSALSVAIKIAKKRKKKQENEHSLVIDIDDPEDHKKGIHKYL